MVRDVNGLGAIAESNCPTRNRSPGQTNL